MSTIVTRAGKGSALTWTEGDANITNLNNDKMENFTVAGDSGSSQTISGGNTLTISGGTGLSSVASATDTITINLDNTAVTAASYTYASITVDAQGRITSASNGTTPLVSGGALGTPSSGTLTNCTFPTLNQNTTGTAGNVTGTVALANGGTGQTSAPAAMAALMGFTTTATAAGTTTLTNASTYYQVFTGSTTQTIVLPSTSTLVAGWTFHICNNSTGNLTLQTSTPTTLITIVPGTTVMVTCISTVDNTTARWEAGFTDFSTITGTGSSVLATSPTITTPTISTPIITEAIYDNGNSGAATITPNATNGSMQKITLTGNITWNAFASPAAGQSITLILIQDGTGSRTLTSTIKWAGGSKTLSTAASSIDIATVYYDGTNYYGSLAKAFA